jgi:hypothetical protein
MIHGSGNDNKRGIKVFSTPSPLRSSYVSNNPDACALWLIVKASMGNIAGSKFKPRWIGFEGEICWINIVRSLLCAMQFEIQRTK